MKITSDEFDGSLIDFQANRSILNGSSCLSLGMTSSASIKNNFFTSNMYLECGLDSRIENERRLLLKLLVNNFMQISVEHATQIKALPYFIDF